MPRAMVKPKPQKPNPELAQLLALFGYDRAYTVVKTSEGVITVWFEGDDHPTVIDTQGEKPEIK